MIDIMSIDVSDYGSCLIGSDFKKRELELMAIFFIQYLQTKKEWCTFSRQDLLPFINFELFCILRLNPMDILHDMIYKKYIEEADNLYRCTDSFKKIVGKFAKESESK